MLDTNVVVSAFSRPAGPPRQILERLLQGEFVLVTDVGRETVGFGTCIGFPAGTGDGHHFLNLTDKDAVFLVVGDRTAGDEVTYPDIDLELKAGPDGVKGFRHKDGTPYPRVTRD